MEKDRPKTQKDSNILDKQFIQKIRLEDFYFRIGMFTYSRWKKRKKAENKLEKTWEVKTSNARGLQHDKVFY